MFLTAFHSIPSSDSASEAPLYPESDREATHPKTSLRSAAQQNTQTQSDLAKLFLLISSAVQRAIDVPVLQCLTAIVTNSLEPYIPTHRIPASNAHFLRLSQSAQSVPSSRFLAQTLFRGIIPCTKMSGFASERWFSSITQWVHNFADNFMLKCCSFQMCSDRGSTYADQGANRDNPPAPPNRRPNSADFADLFCRFVRFLDFFADLFCQLPNSWNTYHRLS